jgi:uncharacterized protein (TIGR02300 family)
VTKPELGTKRICAGCNAKFYDLHKDPIVCPTCQSVFVPPKVAPPRSRRPMDIHPAAASPALAAAPVAVLSDDKPDDDEADDEADHEAGEDAVVAEKTDEVDEAVIDQDFEEA